MDPTTLLLLVATLTILCYYFLKPSNYWKSQGVESAPGAIPIFGNVLSVLLLRENIATLCNRLHKSWPSRSSMIGMYFMRTPLLIVRDPELIKTVLIKDFQSFHNNMLQLSPKLDPFMSKNPFFAVDHTWKEYRGYLVSNMSQKKLKILYGIMEKVSRGFDDYLERIATGEDVELKCSFMKFTGEVVAQTAFGIESQSFDRNRDPRSFSAVVENILESIGVVQTLCFYLPNLANFLGVSFMPREMNEFLRNTISSVLKHRRDEKLVLDDFLQMSIEGVDEPDLDVVTGRISSYFFDAYETSASMAAFAAYHLSRCPDIQEKARKHVDEVLAKHDDRLTYEAVKDMTYLEQIVLETVRLHPILGVTLRVCNERTTLEASDGMKCVLEPGHIVAIPVQGLHTDNCYWKDRMVFDPDRFSEERKNEVTKFTFLPFGEGPRICAGMRYGLMTVKVILAKVLRKFSIESSPRMKELLKYDQRNVLTNLEGGVWARLNKL